MRVLLDESVPRQLASLLKGHEVSRVAQIGWGGLTNGELLQRASSRFDVFVTGDQNLEYQQNLATIELGIVVIAAKNNRVETITALCDEINQAIAEVRTGSVVRVPT